MTFHSLFNKRLHWLFDTLLFLKKHLPVVLGLGLLAAIGRVAQLGGFGTVSAFANVVLEAVVESARLALFIYTLGWANWRAGWQRTKSIFSNRFQWKQALKAILQNGRKNWAIILLNLFGVLCIAALLNYLIDLAAYETCFLLQLKQAGWLTASSSEWTLLLFFKNLSVIPLVLVFDALLLLRITNKLNPQPVTKQG